MKKENLFFIVFGVLAAGFFIFTGVHCVKTELRDTSSTPVVQKVVVERVFQQKPGEYTFTVREGGKLEARSPSDYRMEPRFHPYVNDTTYELYDDVPEGQPMYVELSFWWDGFDQSCLAKVHVHSIKDVGTTGYMTSEKFPKLITPEVGE